MSSMIVSKISKEASQCTLNAIEKEISSILSVDVSFFIEQCKKFALSHSPLSLPDASSFFELFFKEFLLRHSEHPFYLYIQEFSLFEAIKKNKMEPVKYLLSLNNPALSVESVDREGNTPLILACGHASPELVQFLLKCGAELNHENHDGFTPYLYAIKIGNKKVIALLEATYSSLKEATSPSGVSPFIAACRGGDTELMRKMLAKDPKLCEKIGKKLCFVEAARGGYISAMELICSYDPKAFEKNEEDGFTAFMAAASRGHVQCMEWILKRDKDACKKITKNGMTAIQYAARSGSVPAMQLILKYEPRTFEKANSPKFCSSFVYAAYSGEKSALEFIRALDIRPSYFNNVVIPREQIVNFWQKLISIDSVPALEYCLQENFYFYLKGLDSWELFCLAVESRSLRLVEYLFNLNPNYIKNMNLKNYSPTEVEKKIRSCFFKSVEAGSFSILDFFLKQNKSFLNRCTIVERRILDALGTAIRTKKLNGVKYLLFQGVQIDKSVQGLIHKPEYGEIGDYLIAANRMFRHVANGNLPVIKEWVAKKNSLNFRDGEGSTLLHIAFQYKQTAIVNYLIEQGLSIYTLNDRNESPADYALREFGFYGEEDYDETIGIETASVPRVLCDKESLDKTFNIAVRESQAVLQESLIVEEIHHYNKLEFNGKPLDISIYTKKQDRQNHMDSEIVSIFPMNPGISWYEKIVSHLPLPESEETDILRKEIIEDLEKNNIEILDVSYYLSSTGFQLLINAMLINESVKSIKILGDHCGRDVINGLTSLLMKKNLMSLEFTVRPLCKERAKFKRCSEQDFGSFVKALAVNKTLKRLCMENLYRFGTLLLHEQGIGHALAVNTAIEELTLDFRNSETRWNEKNVSVGFKNIIEGLEKNKHIKAFHLYWYHCSAEHLFQLCGYLKRTKTLKLFHFGGMHIGDLDFDEKYFSLRNHFYQVLVDALKENTSLTAVYLPHFVACRRKFMFFYASKLILNLLLDLVTHNRNITVLEFEDSLKRDEESIGIVELIKKQLKSNFNDRKMAFILGLNISSAQKLSSDEKAGEKQHAKLTVLQKFKQHEQFDKNVVKLIFIFAGLMNKDSLKELKETSEPMPKENENTPSPLSFPLPSTEGASSLSLDEFLHEEKVAPIIFSTTTSHASRSQSTRAGTGPVQSRTDRPPSLQ